MLCLLCSHAGSNQHGESTAPAGLTGVTRVAAGLFHTCAVTGSKAVACWGSNDHGQSTVPAGLAGQVAQVAPGGYHTCALLEDHSVTCWG